MRDKSIPNIDGFPWRKLKKYSHSQNSEPPFHPPPQPKCGSFLAITPMFQREEQDFLLLLSLSHAHSQVHFPRLNDYFFLKKELYKKSTHCHHSVFLKQPQKAVDSLKSLLFPHISFSCRHLPEKQAVASAHVALNEKKMKEVRVL